jgi:hypothetical protein
VRTRPRPMAGIGGYGRPARPSVAHSRAIANGTYGTVKPYNCYCSCVRSSDDYPPTEQDAPYESSGPVELLIKDARPKAHHRRLTVGVMLFAVVVVIAAILIAVTRGPATKSVISAPPTCLRSQLRVAFVGLQFGGLGHTASLIQVTNVSGKACSLTGYPRVTGVFASGVQRIFKDTLFGYLGGLFINPSSRAKLPVVTLRARPEVASSMVEGDLRLTCPGFTSYVVSLPHVTGGTYTFHPSLPDQYCFQPEVHPFVHGSTGSAK